MDNLGWILLHRKLLENPVVMKDADHLAIWIYLLLKASHQEHDIWFGKERITLEQGQLITGRKRIADDLRISESKVQRVLKLFESEHQIEQQVNSRNRLISIENWECYQKSEQQSEQQVNNKRTTSEQQVNTNNNVIIKQCKEDNNTADGTAGFSNKKSNVENLNYILESSDYGNREQIKDNPDLREAITVWMEYKDQRSPKSKHRYTERGMKTLLTEILNNVSEYGTKTIAEVIDKTIAKQYDGIGWFFLDNYQKHKEPTKPKPKEPEIDYTGLSFEEAFALGEAQQKAQQEEWDRLYGDNNEDEIYTV